MENWIIQCITTTSFHVMINGNVGTLFTPEGGIREGDPLSPYIFIVCVEYLERLINYLVNQIKSGIGTKIDKDSHNIPYLMFADDCFIFCRVTKKAARMIKQVLDHYWSISGQLINYHKSEVQFSRNVRTFDKKKIAQILQVTPIGNINKYLGCINVDVP